MEPILVTARLALRRFTEADADHLVRLDGDPEVMRFIDSRTKSRADVQRDVLPRFLGFYQRYREFGVFAAETRADGEFVGWFALRPLVPAADAMMFWDDGPPDGRTVSLGYRLVRAEWGNGYATEGSRALVSKAFTELEADEVVATTMAVNTGSRRVMEKAGLRYARTVHVDWPEPLPGNEYGDVEYRLSREDWEGTGGR